MPCNCWEEKNVFGSEKMYLDGPVLVAVVSLEIGWILHTLLVWKSQSWLHLQRATAETLFPC